MDLPATASVDEIEEEILLYRTLIESLDQADSDYEERRTALQNDIDSLEERLSNIDSNNLSAISFDSGSTSLTVPTLDGSPNISSRPVSPNHGDAARNKRSLPDDFTPHFANKASRSLQLNQYVERMKARQWQQWDQFKKRQEQRERDEIFARSLSTQADPVTPSSSRPASTSTFRAPNSSAQMQSTLVPPPASRPLNSPLSRTINVPGQIIPPRSLSYPSPSSQDPVTPLNHNTNYAGSTPYHTGALPMVSPLSGVVNRQKTLPSRIKSEVSSHQYNPTLSVTDGEVIDLTGDDNDLVYPPTLPTSTGIGHTSDPGSSMPAGLPSYSSFAGPSNVAARNAGTITNMPDTYPSAPSGMYDAYSGLFGMPGTYPYRTSSMNFNLGAPSTSQSPWVTSTANVAQAMRQIENPLASLQNLVTGGTSSRIPGWHQDYSEDDDDDDDDEIVYSGTHYGSTYPAGMYAGREGLYRSRYDQIEQYNPEKTREEINALLDNIRPDEELPDELLIQTPEQMNVKLHKYQELGLTWLKKCEEGSNQGGILADDMGLGKTIQMLSLIVSRKSEDSRCKTTLIVAPLALLRQWKQEIENRIKRRFGLTVYTHHGIGKKKQFRDLLLFDVVLTTFGSLAQEYGRKEKFRKRREIDPRATPRSDELCTLIHDDCRWYRVILDEAQCIKNKSTLTAKASFLLKSTYRFCMTGTPMMNNVGELYSLIKFLRIRPYHNWEKFRTDIQQPLKGHERRREAAMQRLQTLCKAIMLRRTKKSQYRGQPILVLPERSTVVDHAEFDEDEQRLYTALETNTQITFNRYLAAGTVGRSYSAILVLLLRLRQACCHPYLIKDLSIAAAADMSSADLLELARSLAPAAVDRIKEANGNFECPICMDAVINPAIFLPCGHDTCRECYVKIADTANANADENRVKARCPHCRGDIDPKKLTDFVSFKRVWQPELLTIEEKREYGMLEEQSSAGKGKENVIEDEIETESQDESTAEEDSETESEEEDDDEDSDSDLDGFIVKDGSSDDESKPRRKIKPQINDSDESGSEFEAKTKKEGKRKVESAEPDKEIKKSKKKRKSKKKKKKKKKAGPIEKIPKTLTIANLKANARGSNRKKAILLEKLRESYTDSAKIRQTIALLEMIAQSDPTEKVLVFSQWTSLLDLCEIAISPKGWNYRRYDGSMNVTDRADAVDDFKDPRKNVRIMFVSLKAGNAGLNLNVASQVIILDPFWNPYIEEQAIDRAHRIGQTRPVRVHRILVPNTVEDRIIEMQDNKRRVIETALDEQSASQLSRLGARELAYLFGVTRNVNDPVPQV